MKPPEPWPKPGVPLVRDNYAPPMMQEPRRPQPYFRICPHCGETTPTHGTFCRMCGKAMQIQRAIIETGIMMFAPAQAMRRLRATGTDSFGPR